MTGNMIKLTFANTHTQTPPSSLPTPKRGAGGRYHLAAPVSAWVSLTGRQGERDRGKDRGREREIKREKERLYAWVTT